MQQLPKRRVRYDLIEAVRLPDTHIPAGLRGCGGVVAKADIPAGTAVAIYEGRIMRRNSAKGWLITDDKSRIMGVNATKKSSNEREMKQLVPDRRRGLFDINAADDGNGVADTINDFRMDVKNLDSPKNDLRKPTSSPASFGTSRPPTFGCPRLPSSQSRTLESTRNFSSTTDGNTGRPSTSKTNRKPTHRHLRDANGRTRPLQLQRVQEEEEEAEGRPLDDGTAVSVSVVKPKLSCHICRAKPGQKFCDCVCNNISDSGRLRKAPRRVPMCLSDLQTGPRDGSAYRRQLPGSARIQRERRPVCALLANPATHALLDDVTLQ